MAWAAPARTKMRANSLILLSINNPSWLGPLQYVSLSYISVIIEMYEMTGGCNDTA